jgi:hypothetical protein
MTISKESNVSIVKSALDTSIKNSPICISRDISEKKQINTSMNKNSREMKHADVLDIPENIIDFLTEVDEEYNPSDNIVAPTIEIYDRANSATATSRGREEIEALMDGVCSGHERIRNGCRPYFDFEQDFTDETEQNASRAQMLKSISALLTNHFKGPFKPKNVVISIFEGSGYNVKKSIKAGHPIYRTSFHAIVSGAGFWPCGKDMIDSCSDAIRNHSFLDKGIYHDVNKDQKFRIPYTPHKFPCDDPRQLRRVTIDCFGKIDTFERRTAKAIDGGIFKWMASYIAEEIEQVPTLRHEKMRSAKNNTGGHSTMRNASKPKQPDISIFTSPQHTQEGEPEFVPQKMNTAALGFALASFGIYMLPSTPPQLPSTLPPLPSTPPPLPSTLPQLPSTLPQLSHTSNADPNIKNLTITHIEALFDIIGFKGKGVCRDVWRDEMIYPLRGIMQDYGIDTRSLAHVVSKADNPSTYDEHDTNILFDTEITGPYKSLGVLRACANKADPSKYKAWRMTVYGTNSLSIFNEPPPEDIGHEEGVVEEELPEIYYSDFAKFANKEVTQEIVQHWVDSTLTLIQSGGAPYIITKSRVFDVVSNTIVACHKPVACHILMKSLDVNIKVINPDFDEKANEDIRIMKLLKKDITPELKRRAVRYLYHSLGDDRGLSVHGYLRNALRTTTLPTYAVEDFIPYLKRRIPDKCIESGINNKHVYNSFTGFPHEAGVIPQANGFENSLWYSHMRDVICSGHEKELTSQIISIADMIQRPYRVSGVMHIYYGGQGIGKSLFMSFIEHLLGSKHVLSVQNMKIYNERFNEDHKHAILKVFEEVSDKGKGFINHETIKYDATKTKTRIEIKGGAIYTVRNCARMYFLSNNKHNMVVEGDDRRGIHHHVSSIKKGDTAYFTELVRLLKDKQFLKEAFEYFAEYEYIETDATRAIDTEYKQDQRVNSIPNAAQAVKDIIENREMNHVDPMMKDGLKIEHKTFYNLYKQWCFDNSATQQKKRTFEIQIEKFGIMKPKCLRINGVAYRSYIIDVLEITKAFQIALAMPSFEFDIVEM